MKMTNKSRLNKSMTLWKKELIESEELLKWLLLGPAAFKKSYDTKPILKKIKKEDSFQSKLIELCKSCKFSVNNPKYIPMPPPPVGKFVGPTSLFRLESGRLDGNVGLALIKVLAENKKNIAALRGQLEATKTQIKNQKFGPPKTPEFFAYHVVMGLDLFKGSVAHLDELKQYLETGSDFEKWIATKIEKGVANLRYKKTIVSLFVKNKSKSGLSNWPGSKRQAMVKALYADKSKKATKRKGEDEETNIIEENIEKKLRAFREKVSKS
jgi:hypothetical protein